MTFGKLAMRDTKQSLGDQLKLPAQRRYVVAFPERLREMKAAEEVALRATQYDVASRRATSNDMLGQDPSNLWLLRASGQMGTHDNESTRSKMTRKGLVGPRRGFEDGHPCSIQDEPPREKYRCDACELMGTTNPSTTKYTKEVPVVLQHSTGHFLLESHVHVSPLRSMGVLRSVPARVGLTVAKDFTTTQSIQLKEQNTAASARGSAITW
ncbi:hypothetical protein G7Y89_g12604 [Cudoniella acicularis]|uniref:Uncharacterized protein n=1 Tax=Cudoniella acicularis TaxID=354080 RepID=A0A8H4R8T9_9HELO|nr:hypothetical protein G7Y89_g12604 [Cudoniella acicularis]